LEIYPNTGGTTAAAAITTNSYFTITLNAASGTTINLNQLQFEVGKGGSADPRGIFVRSSVDGFNADIYSLTLPAGAAAAPALTTIALSGMNGLSTVSFRIYAYSPTPLNNSLDFRNLTISGVATPAAPVPTTGGAALLLMMLAIAACYYRTYTTQGQR
jgi:hypothetical protein